MTFSKILCPTDFSAGSRQAMQTAVRLAIESDAELVLAHAWHVPSTMDTIEYVFPPAALTHMADDAQRALDEAVAQAKAAGATRVSARLASGLPWVQLVDVLQNQPFDLCVMGTHGRTGLARILLGSVAEKVVRHAPCSVLAVRPESEPKPYRHLLVPTDFSERADIAMELAAELVRPDGAGITLLHVRELPVAYASELAIVDFTRDTDQRASDALAKAAAKIAARVAGRVATRSSIGYPGAQILATLEADPSIDLVVMGSHGRTGIERALLGSVAEKIVRHARCPVLVARRR